MNFCKHKYFVIYRGDDTDFPGNQELIVELNTERDLTGCSAHFSFQGFTQDFDEIPADKKLHLIFPSSETKKFALGAADAKLWLTNGTKIRTIENRIHIVVTNRVDEAYNNDDPQAITVTISGGGGGAIVVLDDTVTETSSNGVKSSGIWSWVKSLLPQWLTSDYAEPATVESVENKRDKTDLDIKLPSIESCTWGTPDIDLRDALIGVVPVFSNGKWSAVAGQWTSNLVPGTGYEENVSFLFTDGIRENVPANANMVRGEPETVDTLATTNGVNAAIEAHHDGTKRDLTDNTCYETEFGEWSIPKSHETLLVEPQPKWNGAQGIEWIWLADGYMYQATGTKNSTELDFYDPNPEVYDHFTSKRTAVCTDGKKFVTSDVVDGKVSSAVSTNNPAFVSAVRNTPAPEPGQGEEPPWGTWGTVGAAIAGLVAGLKWLKDKVFDSAGNIQDQFATDLLGKQVAKEAIIYKTNTATGLKDRAFNALTFDGTEYNLSTALEAVTPTASGQPRDLLIVATATAATTISFTAGTIKGDKPTIDGSGTWLITLTEYASGVWYCRQIKMEDAA